MEHVGLPLLASTLDILNNVVQEPFLKNNCKFYLYKYSLIMNLYILFIIIIYLVNDFVLEALQYNLQKSSQNFTISNMI